MTDQIVVVGSINADIIVTVPERPSGGRTVLASELTRRCGGKGANQAAAAARAGATVSLIAAVGDDSDGAEQRKELSRSGVDVTAVGTITEASTGVAFITVTPDGENSIVVAAGANACLDASVVVETLDQRKPPALIVLQTEIDGGVVDAVADWARSHGVRFVLNDGPCIPLAEETLAHADPLVVNEHEAIELCGGVRGVNLARDLASITSARSVVVTRGARGSDVAEGQRAFFVPAAKASRVVDTTGAGDTFLGTLAAELAAGGTLEQSVLRASASAAESVEWMGARPANSAQ